MMAQISIVPIGDDSHLSGPVSKAVKLIHDSGLEYKLTPMGTLIKGEWQEVMDLVKACHEAVRAEHDRVITQIKIDDVKENEPTFAGKMKAVENKAGVEFKK